MKNILQDQPLWQEKYKQKGQHAADKA